MSEPFIAPGNWKMAQDWVDENETQLGLSGYPRIGYLWLLKRTRAYEITLYFLRAKLESGSVLRKILFLLGKKTKGVQGAVSSGVDIARASWNRTRGDEPPESLLALIEAEPGTEQNRAALKKIVATYPGFAEAYSGISQALFPPLEHWELTSAPEEDYKECLTRDEELIKRLSVRTL